MGISRYFRSKEELMAQQEPDVYVPDSRMYVRRGDKCPKCGGDDITWWDVELEGDSIFRGADCNTCSAEWTERYTLTGLEEDPKGRNVLAFNEDGIKGDVSLGKDGLVLSIDGELPRNLLQTLQYIKHLEAIKNAALALAGKSESVLEFMEAALSGTVHNGTRLEYDQETRVLIQALMGAVKSRLEAARESKKKNE